jgi:hypothetical protein
VFPAQHRKREIPWDSNRVLDWAMEANRLDSFDREIEDKSIKMGNESVIQIRAQPSTRRYPVRSPVCGYRLWESTFDSIE